MSNRLFSVAHKPSASIWYTSFHTLGTSLISVAIGFAVSVFVARLAGPEGKGNFDLFLATAGLLGVVLGFSLPAGVTYVIANRKAALSPLTAFYGAAVVILLAGAAIFIRLVQGGPLQAAFLPQGFNDRAFLLLLLWLAANAFLSYWNAVMIAFGRIVESNHSQLIARAVFLALLSLAALPFLAPRIGYLTLIAFNLASLLVGNFLYLRLLRRYWQRGKGALRELFAFALPSHTGNLLQFLNYRLDIFFVSYFQGQASLGLYTLAVSLAQMIWLVSNAFATNLFPKVAAVGGKGDEILRHTAQLTRFSLWASLIGGAGLAALSALFLTGIYGERFQPSLTPLFWLIPGAAAFSVVNVLAAYIAGAGKPRVNAGIALAGLVVTITLDILLIPAYSIVGAAVASTISYTLSAALTLAYVTSRSSLSLRSLLLPTTRDFSRLIELARSALEGRRPL